MANSTRPSRRAFLKASAAGAATLAGLGIARSAHAAGKQEIKIGMIGCGSRCGGAAEEALQAGPDVKLAAMCDIFPDRLKFKYDWFKKNRPSQVIADRDHLFAGFDGYKKVIDSADVVLIACASKFHPMYAEAAIRAGKHVFVEKPHGIDPLGVRRMQAAARLAEQKNLSLLSGLQSRFSNGYRQAVQRIHDGAIGKVVAMQVMFLRGPYQIVTRNPAYSETQYQFSNWYHFRWLSGDDVTQSLVHNMDRAAWILHEEMPSWCFGLGGRSASFGDAYGDMYDHHTVVYEYASGPRVYALCRTQNHCYGNSGDIIMGTKGQCDLGNCRITGETNWRFKDPHNNPYLDEQRVLIDAVRSGKPINSGSYMAGSTMSTVLGQLACYTGQPLKWGDVAQLDFQFGPAPEAANFDTPPPSKPDAAGNYPLPQPGVYDDPLKAGKDEKWLPVQIPNAGDAVPITVRPAEMIINIDQEGRCCIGDLPASLHDVDLGLQRPRLAKQGKTSVTLRVDERCPWKFVSQIIDCCKKNKVAEYRVTTTKAVGDKAQGGR